MYENSLTPEGCFHIYQLKMKSFSALTLKSDGLCAEVKTYLHIHIFWNCFKH